MSGDVIQTAFSTFGDASVFIGCAKIAQLIIAKNKALSTFNKIGFVVGTGGSGLTTYKVLNKSFTFLGFKKDQVILNGTLSLALRTVTLSSNASYPIQEHPVLSYIFGMHKDVTFTKLNQPYQIINNPQLGTTTIEATQTNNSVIETLNSTNPN